MKLSNKKNIRITMYILLLLLFLDIVFLCTAKVFFKVNNNLVYILLFLIFVMIVWKLSVLKVTEVDISEHIISVKLRRPFLQIRKVTPVLEVPIDKIESCKMRKGFMDSFLVITINTKKRKRIFYYRMGFLTKRQIENYQKCLIKLSNISKV